MMSTEQVTCRYYVQRVCWEANKRLFSHDLSTSKSSSIFKYYQKGRCAYSAWYRYDHMRLTAPQPLCCPWQSPKAPECDPTNMQSKQRKRMLRDRNLCGLSEEQQKSSALRAVLRCSNQNNNLEVKPHYYSEAICSGLEDLVAPVVTESSCPYMVKGMWHIGECCLHLHEVMGELYGLQVLHPFNQNQRKAHKMMCRVIFELDMEKAFAFQASEVKVCSICMEVLYEKPPPLRGGLGSFPTATTRTSCPASGSGEVPSSSRNPSSSPVQSAK